MNQFAKLLFHFTTVFYCGALLAAPSWDDALPLLEKYCFDCHDEDVTKGEVDLAAFRDEAEAMQQVRMWEKAGKLVHDYEMPPSDKKKQPSDAERKILQGWITDALDRMALANAGDPGKVTMRRLTNAEYDNTIRDLTGLELNLSWKFPKDGGGGEGFANTGDTLFTSPEQIEKYITAARTLTSHLSAKPGAGLQFEEEVIGTRGTKLLYSSVMKESADWYSERVTPLMPDKPEELREADYLLACWKHRNGMGALPELAKASGLNPDFLDNWWFFLNHNDTPSRFLDLTRNPWKNLPGKDQEKAAREQIQEIADQRQSWLRGWENGYSIQRQQQDVDSLNPTFIYTKRGKNGMIYLCATDLGDGNRGDIVRWMNPVLRMKDESEMNLFDHVELQLQWHEGILSKGEGDLERAKDNITWLKSLLELRGKHPTGKEISWNSFAVKAPSRIGFYLPEEALGLKVSAEVEQEDEERELTSLQAFTRADSAPDPLPAIMPGELTQWHRSTEAHQQLYREFEAMKQIFRADRDKRVDWVARNGWAESPEGVYFLTKKQLIQRLPDHEKQIPDQFFLDEWLTRQESLNDSQENRWDSDLIQHLGNFAERAWRRPISDAQRQSLAKLYRQAFAEVENREEACREVIVRILVSPNFLFKTEPPREAKPETPLDGWEYASRLSYFLWSSMPDAKLTAHAQSGKILESGELDGLIKPMLTDWRSNALARNFAGQWFGFADFTHHGTVDGEKFKTAWGDGVRWSMFREAILFFENLVQKDRPVTDILHADYTYLDGRLAKHYGVPGVEGEGGNFREWNVAAQNRGGILGMGALLTKTSYPRRTSPVLRGDWVLRTVLGEETPPPPADVPELDDDGLGEDLGLRERLEKHQEARECATCHAKIDPPGFALENFDAIGRWRDTDESGRPIDANAKLKDGTQFTGIQGLKKHLHNEEAAFLRQFCTKLLGYALGREVGIGDRPLLEEMEASLKRDGYRFSAAVRAIVQSRQFRNRRNDS